MWRLPERAPPPVSCSYCNVDERQRPSAQSSARRSGALPWTRNQVGMLLGAGLLSASSVVSFTLGPTSVDLAATTTARHLPSIRPPRLATGGIVDASSCVLGPNCTEIGWNHRGNHGFLWTARWGSGTWTRIAAPAGSGVPGLEHLTLSCATRLWCMASGMVGENTRGATIPYSAVLDGRSWTRYDVPNPAGASDFDLDHLDCRSSSWCIATGTYVASLPHYRDAQFLASYLWSGTAWHRVHIFSPRTDAPQLDPGFDAGGDHPTASLQQLACTSSTSCIVVGSWTTGAFGERWNGQRWSAMKVPDQSGRPAADTELSGIACPSSRRCFAAGGYPIANGIWSPFADEWSGTHWTPDRMPKNPRGSNSDGGFRMDGITCASSSYCIARSEEGSIAPHQMALLWNGRVWSYVQSGTFESGAIVCLTSTYCD
jgi:hypothetical protein